MSDTTSSSFTLIFSPVIETYILETILGTTVKLNGSNYLLWAQTFCIFIGAQNKLDHLLESPPATTNLTYTTGFLENIVVVFSFGAKKKEETYLSLIDDKIRTASGASPSWWFLSTSSPSGGSPSPGTFNLYLPWSLFLSFLSLVSPRISLPLDLYLLSLPLSISLCFLSRSFSTLSRGIILLFVLM